MESPRDFPIRVYYRDPTSTGTGIHPVGFRLWSHHKSGRAGESAYKKLIKEMPNTDIEIVDVSTGERKRYGSAEWRLGHAWNIPFKIK